MLGGGTKIEKLKQGSLCLRVQSVGHRLQQEALVFGGAVPTMTDVAAVIGHVTMGERQKAVHALETEAQALYKAAVKRIENSILYETNRNSGVDLLLQVHEN